nr:MAG: replication initiator protein [Microvirus sp.]
MSCDFPIKAWYGNLLESGKRGLVFKHALAWPPLAQAPLELPCGRCLGCRLEYSRRWAIRLMHENKMHSESCFVTWTYDNDSLPVAGSLVKSHLQGVHKRLHNRLLDKRGYGIRYYGCGEYGDLNKRPHYHSLIFGFRPEDGRFFSRNGRDECVYDSEFLNDVWQFKGAARFGDVTFDSCAYVARYVTKKVNISDKTPERLRDTYVVYDADGLIHERVPEFAMMSRRPGIGATYYAKYGSEIRTHDSVIVNGKAVPSTRYYDDLGKCLDPERAKWLKFRRLEKVVPSEQLVDRRKTKRILRQQMHKLKERRL